MSATSPSHALLHSFLPTTPINSDAMVSEPTFQSSSIFLTKGPPRTLGRTLSSLLSEEPPTMLSYYPRSAFPLIEDCIGEESCVDLMPGLFNMPMKPDNEAAAMERVLSMKRSSGWERRREAEEYPPLIPMLARTGNQPSHMPWVLKRTYTADGRLILREERVRHHEYFRAHRSNGRLTLQLIPLDDEVFDPETEPEPEADHEPSPIDNNDRSEAEVINGEDTNEEELEEDYDREFVDSAVDEEEAAVVTATAVAEIGGGSVGKCLKGYSIGGGVNVNGASSCIFGVAVPAL